MPDTLALLEALYAHAPVGLGYVDADLRHRQVNDRLAKINGVPAGDHLGRRPSEILGAVGEQVEALFREVRETGRPVGDVRISGETPAEPGRVRHRLASYYPVVGADGALRDDLALLAIRAAPPTGALE